MRKTILSIVLILCTLSVYAQYYDAVLNLSGQELYLALRNLISTNTNTDYIDAKEQMFGYFDNESGLVRCVYTGQDWSVPPGGMPNQNLFNTEHTYAQSWFSAPQTNIKKADLHHLFPTNAQVNSSRGNLPFDVVANHSSATTYVSYNSYYSYRGNNAQGRLVFEPANQHKGNLARSLLYFNTRYNDTLTQANVDMIPVLIQWHLLDPVDSKEIERNQDIYGYQNNRNPFVDHPEFVQRIWVPTDISDQSLPIAPELVVSSIYPNPFANELNLSYCLGNSTQVSVEVFNVKGQRIHSISAMEKTPGVYSLSLEMDNAIAGIYLIRISTSEQAIVKRVMKL